MLFKSPCHSHCRDGFESRVDRVPSEGPMIFRSFGSASDEPSSSFTTSLSFVITRGSPPRFTSSQDEVFFSMMISRSVQPKLFLDSEVTIEARKARFLFPQKLQRTTLKSLPNLTWDLSKANVRAYLCNSSASPLFTWSRFFCDAGSQRGWRKASDLAAR